MSYLLFMDESGHDHRSTPYEVRGGIALHIRRLWSFISALRDLEVACFGDHLHSYGKEFKGCKLLDRDRFRWAGQAEQLPDQSRRKHAVSFLNRGVRKESPQRDEFTAFGQASLAMAQGVFQLLQDHDAALFAAVTPTDVKRPRDWRSEDVLRKDQVFLLERFFYFLEQENAHGLMVLDQTEKVQDRRFVSGLQHYFTKTQNGRYRAGRVVPVPLFVASDMSRLIQAADVCIYCLNWGFRLPTRGMDGPVREEIADEFGPWINRLQFQGEGHRDGDVFQSYGIVYVPDPYG